MINNCLSTPLGGGEACDVLLHHEVPVREEEGGAASGRVHALVRTIHPRHHRLERSNRKFEEISRKLRVKDTKTATDLSKKNLPKNKETGKKSHPTFSNGK
jgi:hypothetical protein